MCNYLIRLCPQSYTSCKGKFTGLPVTLKTSVSLRFFVPVRYSSYQVFKLSTTVLVYSPRTSLYTHASIALLYVKLPDI